jgi:ribonuclease HI
MKKLKFDHELAQQVLRGEKNSTWRMFDDKDLSVGDVLLLIDKVDSHVPDTWKAIGIATIDRIVERRLFDISENELDGHEVFISKQEMLTTYRKYYGENVNWQTPIKIIDFHFRAAILGSLRSGVSSPPEKVILYADGGSRGNPGPSASGYVIYDELRTQLLNQGVYLGITTNNQAEYMALKLGLEAAKNIGAHEVHVYMDSMLVVNQMRGIFKVKNRDLWPIHDAIKRLLKDFRHVDFTQIPRTLNKAADAAVNMALDQHLLQQVTGDVPDSRTREVL